jgi:hypothetical protein
MRHAGLESDALATEPTGQSVLQPVSYGTPPKAVLIIRRHVVRLMMNLLYRRHTEAWPVLGPYMGRVSPECTVIRPVLFRMTPVLD